MIYKFVVKMLLKCFVCNREVVDVEEGGELVCIECGVVVEGRVFNFDVDC